MGLNFGKLNFSTSLNPTSAFPLDARSYFESYEAAALAASFATEAGSSKSTYYYGQTLTVVENNKATFYIIQPNGTLQQISNSGSNENTSININQKLFEYDEYKGLSLIGFNQAEEGTYFTKNKNGSIDWIKPIDAYTKTETNEKIAKAVSEANHLKRKIVNSLDEAKNYIANNNDADQYIFMVPTGLEQDDDKYDEYVVIVVADIPTLEKVGSWEVDLSDYAKTSDIKEALEKKVDKVEGYGLISNTDLEKLLSLKPSIIENVDESNFLIENKILYLKDLPIAKVTGLEAFLNSKVDAKPGYGLISETDQKKLDALLLDTDGKLEISGKVNAENVVNLTEWINENASSTVGLSENNLTNELYSKLTSMLYITSVKPEELDVTNGHLSIVSVDFSKITGLQDALNEKANQEDFENAVKKVDDLSTLMSQYKIKIDTHDSEIKDLWDAVIWQDII